MNPKGNPNIKNHGRKGGKTTAKKYGSAYMRKIGKRGRKKQLLSVKK